jgi:hypothetical protein
MDVAVLAGVNENTGGRLHLVVTMLTFELLRTGFTGRNCSAAAHAQPTPYLPKLPGPARRTSQR